MHPSVLSHPGQTGEITSRSCHNVTKRNLFKETPSPSVSLRRFPARCRGRQYNLLVMMRALGAACWHKYGTPAPIQLPLPLLSSLRVSAAKSCPSPMVANGTLSSSVDPQARHRPITHEHLGKAPFHMLGHTLSKQWPLTIIIGILSTLAVYLQKKISKSEILGC